MIPHPPPNVLGKTESERFDNAVKKVFSVTVKAVQKAKGRVKMAREKNSLGRNRKKGMKHRVSASLLSVAFVLAAVSQTAEERIAKGPGLPNFYVVNATLIRDEDCARDYAKALDSGGVEMQKLIADIFQYGCAREIKGIFNARGKIVEIKGASGSRPREFFHAALTAEFELTETVSKGKMKIDPFDFALTGYLPISDVPSYARDANRDSGQGISKAPKKTTKR